MAHILEDTAYNLEVTSYNLEITGYNLEVTGYNLEVTTHILVTITPAPFLLQGSKSIGIRGVLKGIIELGMASLELRYII